MKLETRMRAKTGPMLSRMVHDEKLPRFCRPDEATHMRVYKMIGCGGWWAVDGADCGGRRRTLEQATLPTFEAAVAELPYFEARMTGRRTPGEVTS